MIYIIYLSLGNETPYIAGYSGQKKISFLNNILWPNAVLRMFKKKLRPLLVLEICGF